MKTSIAVPFKYIYIYRHVQQSQSPPSYTGTPIVWSATAKKSMVVLFIFFLNPSQNPTRTLSSWVKRPNLTVKTDIVNFSESPQGHVWFPQGIMSIILARWHMNKFAPLNWQNSEVRQAGQTRSCFWYPSP